MLKKNFYTLLYLVYISSSYSIFFYYHLKNINQSIRKKKKKTRKKSRYAVSRYAVTSLPVTPLRVLLTTQTRLNSYHLMFYGHAMFKGNSQKESKYFNIISGLSLSHRSNSENLTRFKIATDTLINDVCWRILYRRNRKTESLSCCPN